MNFRFIKVQPFRFMKVQPGKFYLYNLFFTDHFRIGNVSNQALMAKTLQYSRSKYQPDPATFKYQ